MDVWLDAGYSRVALALPRDFYIDPEPDVWSSSSSPNGTLDRDNGLSNTFIDHYSDRAAALVTALGTKVEAYWVWNEPNLNGNIATNTPPSNDQLESMSPENFGALLYTTSKKMKAAGARAVYCGSMNFANNLTGPTAVGSYITAMYNYLKLDRQSNTLKIADFKWDMLSINVTGLPTSAWFTSRFNNAVTAQKDSGHDIPNLIAEWGTQPENVTEQLAIDTFNMLLGLVSSKIMYFFSHHFPGGDGMGATEFTFQALGTELVPKRDSEGDIIHKNWYDILKDHIYPTVP